MKQEKLLRLCLFNVVMNCITETIKFVAGYKMDKHDINIYYSNDTVLTVNNGDDLQIVTHEFIKTTSTFSFRYQFKKVILSRVKIGNKVVADLYVSIRTTC